MKFIISWDAGFGTTYGVIDAESEEAATMVAYENWLEEAEGQSIYSAKEWSQEEADDCGAEDWT